MSSRSAAAMLIGLQAIAGGCAIALTVVPGYDAVLLLPFMALFFALVALFLMDRLSTRRLRGKSKTCPGSRALS